MCMTMRQEARSERGLTNLAKLYEQILTLSPLHCPPPLTNSQRRNTRAHIRCLLPESRRECSGQLINNFSYLQR